MEAEEFNLFGNNYITIITTEIDKYLVREIYLSHNSVQYATGNSYYAREIQYLIKNGYKFIKEGDIWHAVR